ncbi:MAG: DNA gyrase C-terminal beta-propeller domain-containing protein, partial [Bacteroidia bacterium]|nr:DNA gyrase C-terminal beta-propeller domain-containing protein [Bacteroidia bacterium]
LAAELVTETSEVVIATTYGMACRFGATDVRDMGRGATGVRGIRLSGKPDDKVVGMVAISNEKEQLLVVSENGYGKRSEVLEYRKTNRGAQGVKTLNITEKTGKLMAINRVTEAEGLMIVTQAGITIRMNVADTPLLGRNAQGSRLIRLRDDDAIASVALLPETVTDDETAPEEAPVQPPAE